MGSDSGDQRQEPRLGMASLQDYPTPETYHLSRDPPTKGGDGQTHPGCDAFKGPYRFEALCWQTRDLRLCTFPPSPFEVPSVLLEGV